MKRFTGHLNPLALALVCTATLTLGACDEEALLGPDAGVDAATGPTFTALYNSTSFQTCAGCHAPEAPGATEGTETTQDWSAREMAYQTIQGVAAGLIGNFADCNGVPLLGDTPENSLMVATFDETVRAEFTLDGFPDCNADTISDMTLKIGGPLAADELELLKQWIIEGAPDN